MPAEGKGNPTIQNIFQQINELRSLIGQSPKSIRLAFPEYQFPGKIKYPGLKPFIYYKQITMKGEGANPGYFGESSNTFHGEYKPDDSDPTYLQRIFSSLRTAKGGEGSHLDRFRPLALDGQFVITGTEETTDFLWRFLQDQTVRNVVPDWLPSTLLQNDHKDGFRLIQPWELKRGETIKFEAQPLYAQPQLGWDLKFYLELVKMVPDQATVSATNAD